MPLTTVEVFVLFYYRSMGLPFLAVQEILRLKVHPHTPLMSNLSLRVTEVCTKEQQDGYPAMRRSTGEWNKPVLDDFLKRTASGLSEEAQSYLTHIGDAEQEIIDRYTGKRKQSSKQPRTREHNASQSGPGRGQSSRAPAFPPAQTAGFTPINQHQPHETIHTTNILSRKRSRGKVSPHRSHHYQNSDTSKATDFQSPFGPSGNDDGRLIDNQHAYNAAKFGGGRTNAVPPFQSSEYPYGAPTPYREYQPESHGEYHSGPYGDYHSGPYSDYHSEPSDRRAKRRSTGPSETSGYSSITPRPKGPRDPGGRRDVYF